MKPERLEEFRLEALREEIIEINYYILKAIHEDNKSNVLKYKIMLDNLINIYLKND